MCSCFVLSISHFTAGLSNSFLFAVLNTMIDLNSEQALVKGLAARPEVENVQLLTRLIVDRRVSSDYSNSIEKISHSLN